ncbi:MAG: hypothetical protein ACRECW_09520 [Phyllobacterium sp.]
MKQFARPALLIAAGFLLFGIAACTSSARPMPRLPINREHPVEPLPSTIKPLTLEQEEQIAG